MPNGEQEMECEEHYYIGKIKNNDQKFEFFKMNKEETTYIDKAIEYIKKVGPKDLNQFTIEGLIGKGSESLVFKIRLNKTNKYYALKVIKKPKNISNTNELKISRKVKHRNIATILCYYADTNKEEDYIIMELGHSNLTQFTKKTIKRYTLSESFLCMIAYQTLQGLAYLQKMKIAHLDVKPQNILINEYLDIKLIDFSVSLDYSNIQNEDVILPYSGTPFFMSPEILGRKRIKTKDIQKVDMFSLGVTLYILGFGQLPFNIGQEDSDEEMLNKIKSGWKVEDSNNIFSSHFINLLNGLLEVNIKKRLSINQALNDYWIRGAEIILNEKENTYNANSFLSYLITDHIRSFQEYIYN